MEKFLALTREIYTGTIFIADAQKMVDFSTSTN